MKNKSTTALNFLIGEVIKKFKGRVDPKLVREALIRKLDNEDRK